MSPSDQIFEHPIIKTLFPDRIIRSGEKEYHIVGFLGEGRSPCLEIESEGKRYAAKLIQHNISFLGYDKEGRRTLTEAQALRLNHPGIKCEHEFVEMPDQRLTIFIREKAPGRNLEELLREKGSFTESEVVDYLRKISVPLEYAHDASQHTALGVVIHRDIKPQNIIIDDEGNVRVIDWEIARLENGSRTTVTSKIGDMSLAYSSPEHFGIGEVGLWTDIYCLGATAIHLLLGEVPKEFIDKKLWGNEYQLPEERVSPKLREIVHKMVAREASDRYQNIADLRKDLNEGSELEIVVNTGLVPAEREGYSPKDFTMRGIQILTLSGAAAPLVLGLANHIPNLVYSGLALEGMALVVTELVYRFFSSKNFSIKDETASSASQSETGNLMLEENSTDFGKPRGKIGRTWDNLLRRDTPHRRYFRSVRELRRGIKKGALSEAEFERKVTSLEQMRTEAHYDKPIDYDEQKVINRTRRRTTLEKQIDRMIKEADEKFPEALQEYRSLSEIVGGSSVDFNHLQFQWRVSRVRSQDYSSYADPLDRRFYEYGHLIPEARLSPESRHWIEAAMQDARNGNRVSSGYEPAIRLAEEKGPIPNELKELIYELYEYAKPTEIPKRVEESLLEAMKNAKGGNRTFYECVIRTAQKFAAEIGMEISDSRLHDIEAVYQANKVGYNTKEMNHWLGIARTERSSGDQKWEVSLRIANQYASEIGRTLTEYDLGHRKI